MGPTVEVPVLWLVVGGFAISTFTFVLAALLFGAGHPSQPPPFPPHWSDPE